MKPVIRVCLAILCSFSLLSCSKENDNGDLLLPPVSTEPSITSKIYPFINQPSAMELGTGAAVLASGSELTIYVPYGIYLDQTVASEISFTDATTGEELATLPLVKSTDAASYSLDIPAELRQVPFMFVSFSPDDNFQGRSVNIKSTIKGSKLNSTDSLQNAFSVDL